MAFKTETNFIFFLKILAKATFGTLTLEIKFLPNTEVLNLFPQWK